MQINISFEADDLADLYDNLNAVVDPTLSDADKADWLRLNYLEPLVDAYLLNAINKARENKAYDAAMVEARAGQDALTEKIGQAQKRKLDALVKPPIDATTPAKGSTKTKGT